MYRVMDANGTLCITANFSLSVSVTFLDMTYGGYQDTTVNLPFLNTGRVHPDRSRCGATPTLALDTFLPDWLLELRFARNGSTGNDTDSIYYLDTVQLRYTLNSSRFPGAADTRDRLSEAGDLALAVRPFGATFHSPEVVVELNANPEGVVVPSVAELKVTLTEVTWEAFVGEVCEEPTAGTTAEVPVTATPVPVVVPSYVVRSNDGNVCIRADFIWREWQFVYTVGNTTMTFPTFAFDTGSVAPTSNCTLLEVTGTSGYQSTPWRLCLSFAQLQDEWSVGDLSLSVFLPLPDTTGMLLYNATTPGDHFRTPLGASYHCDANTTLTLEGIPLIRGMELVISGGLQLEAFLPPGNDGNFSTSAGRCDGETTPTASYIIAIVIAAGLATLVALVVGCYVLGRACMKRSHYDQM